MNWLFFQETPIWLAIPCGKLEFCFLGIFYIHLGESYPSIAPFTSLLNNILLKFLEQNQVQRIVRQMLYHGPMVPVKRRILFQFLLFLPFHHCGQGQNLAHETCSRELSSHDLCSRPDQHHLNWLVYDKCRTSTGNVIIPIKTIASSTPYIFISIACPLVVFTYLIGQEYFSLLWLISAFFFFFLTFSSTYYCECLQSCTIKTFLGSPVRFSKEAYITTT